MMKQLSVFAENKKGAINDITKELADANINLYALLTNDSSAFAIVRMIVSDTEKAQEILKKRYLTHLDSVLAVRVSNEVGSLNHLLEDVKECNINIDYLYTTFGWDTSQPIMLIHCEEEEELEISLKNKGYDLM
ncbi:MAG: ACT domain-containing protein [Absicoccus sp.]|uniref:ACT domain-containing protein n=1 Tax=Absicoccus sp. TaxID=2718527 RepID=UPI002A765AC5|nr:ACT domain-containing protein [Absicoccus sp.]MDY3036320.1 ACT domain-containing protein [Absicoccus sp.]